MTNNDSLSRRNILKGSLGLAAGATAVIAANNSIAQELTVPKALKWQSARMLSAQKKFS